MRTLQAFTFFIIHAVFLSACGAERTADPYNVELTQSKDMPIIPVPVGENVIAREEIQQQYELLLSQVIAKTELWPVVRKQLLALVSQGANSKVSIANSSSQFNTIGYIACLVQDWQAVEWLARNKVSFKDVKIFLNKDDSKKFIPAWFGAPFELIKKLTILNAIDLAAVDWQGKNIYHYAMLPGIERKNDWYAVAKWVSHYKEPKIKWVPDLQGNSPLHTLMTHLYEYPVTYLDKPSPVFMEKVLFCINLGVPLDHRNQQEHTVFDMINNVIHANAMAAKDFLANKLEKDQIISQRVGNNSILKDKYDEYLQKTFDFAKKGIVLAAGELDKRIQKIIHYVLNHEMYSKKMAPGVLLMGEKGTGKSLTADRTILEIVQKCNEKGLRCFVHVMDQSKFASKWAGEETNNLGKFFDQVEEEAKLGIVIIKDEEMDGSSPKRTTNSDSVAQERNRTAGLKLERIDRLYNNVKIGKSYPVLIIGTTNFSENIDEALLRPGRFETRITVKKPNYNERIAIIKLGLKDENHSLTEQDIATFANECGQWSFTDEKNKHTFWVQKNSKVTHAELSNIVARASQNRVFQSHQGVVNISPITLKDLRKARKDLDKELEDLKENSSSSINSNIKDVPLFFKCMSVGMVALGFVTRVLPLVINIYRANNPNPQPNNNPPNVPAPVPNP